MDKRRKIKIVVSSVCLLISIAALYAFIVRPDLSGGRRIALVVIAVGWIVSGIAKLVECFKKGR